MVTNTAKLQEKIMALTNIDGNGGIDILTDAGEFKSTYEILLAISKIWKDMDDTSQAALLELVAGKTRGSVVAALFQNGDVLEEAYASASEASGSAMHELETYLDSVQGKLDQFTNSVQTMWMNMLDSEVIKRFVGLGTTLVNLADKIGVIRLLFIGITTILMRKNGIASIGEFFKAGAISAEEASKKLAELKARYDALDGSKSQRNLRKQDRIGQQMKPYQAIVDGAKKAKEAQDNLAKAQSKLKTAEDNLAKSQGKGKKKKNTKKIKEYQDAVNGAKKEVENAKKEVEKCEEANRKLGNSGVRGFKNLKDNAKAFGKELWSIGKQMLEMYAITAIFDVLRWAGEGVVNFFDGMYETAEEAQEKLDELKNELEAIESEIDSLNSELETTNESIEELMDKGTLSFTEQEELDRLKSVSAELEKQIQFQETLREAKSKAVNAQAVDATSKYLNETSFYSDKSRTERQEEAKGKGENIGSLVGMAAGVGLSFVPFLQPFSMALIGGLSALGKWLGGAIGSGSAGNKYDSEESVADAIANMQETREKFKEDIQKAIDDGDAEAYNEATEALTNYDAKMADHMSVISQNANSFDWETATEEQKKQMQEQLNLLDAYNIAMGGKDAKVNALDRLFGENADEIVKVYRDLARDAVAAGESFDFTEADAQTIGLNDDLEALGLTIQDVTDYFTQLGEAGADAVEEIDFSDVVSELAKVEGALGSVKSVMEEFRTEGIVSASTLEGMQEAFGGLGDVWENYAETMMSGTASMAEVQAATEALAKAYLDANVDKLNKDNGLTYIAQLERFGVDNAKGLVDSYINKLFWNSSEFANFNGSAQELIELAKEYGVTITDVAKAEELLKKKNDARTKRTAHNEQVLAKERAKERKELIETAKSDKTINGYLAEYNEANTQTGKYAPGKYLNKEALQQASYYKNLIIEKLSGFGLEWDDLFSEETEVVPEITVSQDEVDKAEKEYQDKLDGMDLSVTPDVNFNTNNALEETAEVEEAFASLKDVYDEFEEHNIVSAKSLAALEETFGNIDGFKEFVNILGDSNSTIEDVDKAIQGLANGFLNDFDYSTLFGEDGLLDESEVNRVSSQLENIGVENADALIRQKAQAYNAIKEMYGIDLANYDSAEQAKSAILAKKISEQVGITGENLVNKFVELYGIDLKNFEGTWDEKVKCAKEAATEIVKAEYAAKRSKLDEEFTPDELDLMSPDPDNPEYNPFDSKDRLYRQKEYERQALENEKLYLREKKKLEEEEAAALAEIESLGVEEPSDEDTGNIFEYYKPTTINPTQIGGNDDNGSGSTSEIDWLDHYFTTIENKIKEGEADLENVMSADIGSIDEKNTIIDSIIGLYNSKIPKLEKAMNAYKNRAADLFNGFSSDIQSKILNGSIDLSEYDDETAEKLEEYYDYTSKASELGIELDGVKVTIADLSLQKFDNVAKAFDNEIEEALQSDEDLLQARINLLEDQGEIVSPKMYESLIAMENAEIGVLKDKKKSLEDVLNAEVAAGRIKVGSEQWYEMKKAIDDVDAAIIESTANVEGFQNEIQNLHWESFDRIVDEFEHLGSEIAFVYGLLSDDDKVVDEFGNWTDEGITALALMAQEMERAKKSAEYYESEIETLNATWQESGYSQTEYEAKLRELEEKHWDSIEAYEAAKEAIVGLNKARVEAAKDAIDKEIEALEEKNEKLKESIDLEKEQYDFQKQISEKEKSIADIQRRLNALAGDNSASAIAERRKLEAELAEAMQEMDDMWYEHSIDEQQKTLDESLENYKDNKEDEKEALDESLKDENKLVQDAFDLINTKIGTISSTLAEFENEHGIKLSSIIVDPWNDGVAAMDAYSQKLSEICQDEEEAKEKADDAAVDAVITAAGAAVDAAVGVLGNSNILSTGSTTPSYREYTVKENDTLSDIAQDELGSASRWQEIYNLNKDVISNPNLIYPGQKIKLPHYAKGTMGAEYDHWAMVDELGPELQLVPDGSGRLSYITRGTSVIPHDLSEKIVDLALDPTKVLEQSRPAIGAPHITTNNFDIDLSFGSLVHVDHCDQNTLPDLQKMVRGEFDNMMKAINQKLKRK